MKEFLGGMVLTALLGYLGTCVAWWGLVLVGAVVGFAIHRHGGWAFLSGFLGGALFYGVYTYVLDYQNGGRLSAMMADLLPVDPFWATVVLGGLWGGLGNLMGKYAREVLFGTRKVPKYRGKYR